MTGPSLTSMKHLKHEHMYQRRVHVFVLKDKRDQVGMTFIHNKMFLFYFYKNRGAEM